MYWDLLPSDIIQHIFKHRKFLTCSIKASNIIKNRWNTYKIKKLVNTYKSLKNIREFIYWNSNIQMFLLRSKL